MFALSTFLKDKIIDHVLRNQSYVAPTTVYVALFTSGSGLEENLPTSEVVGDGYERLEVTLSAPDEGSTENTGELLFEPAESSWGAITYAAIVDHPTSADWGNDVNVLLQAPLTTPKVIQEGDTFKIPVAAIQVTLN